MRAPSCPKCGHDQFEPEVYKAQASDAQLTLVQCAQCGTVVGVDFDPDRDLEWKDLISFVRDIRDRVERIEKSLKGI